MRARTARLTTTRGVHLEWLTTGAGEPVTIFAHGLAGNIGTTRPLGSAVSGRRIFFHFRGHGRSTAPPGRWRYPELAGDLRAVADEAGASRAVGVSMGAAALCRVLVDDPDRFERLVFFLPAALDRPRPGAVERLRRLLTAVRAGDAAVLRSLLAPELPAQVTGTPAAEAHLRARVAQLLDDGLAPELVGLYEAAAVAEPADLAGVTAPALVIACAGDDLHPVAVAEGLAAALPAAQLIVYDAPAPLWTRRSDLRERISDFLNR